MATVVRIPTKKTVKQTSPLPEKSKGGYYTSKDNPAEVYFRQGIRRSKKDPLVATCVDEDSAAILVETANVYWRCTCGEADELEATILGEEEE